MYRIIKSQDKYQIEYEGKIYSEGMEIKSVIHYIDNFGTEQKENIEGIIHYINNHLISLKINNRYISTFQINELFKSENNIQISKAKFDAGIYEQSAINECINNLNNKKVGYVFNREQLNKVYEKHNIDYCKVSYEDGIYIIKNIL